MTVEIRILRSDEAHTLEHVAPGVFDNPVHLEHSAEFLADRRHHLAIALDGDTVVGMASAVDYVHPDKPVELWINEIGVAPEYRQEGIGRRLLQALLDLGRELGCREAWVATEPDNLAAGRLYTTVGGESESSVIYSFKIGKAGEA